MIPQNITKEHIIQAIQEIQSQEKIDPHRESVYYDLYYNDKRYPPNYVISIANKYANGNELDPTEATDAKKFLLKLGFEIKLKYDIKPKDVLTNQELSTHFSVEPQGAMRRSNKSNTLILISDHTKDFYKDIWKGTVFHYTGIGLTDDQKTILTESKTNRVKLYLFEIFSPGQYTYQGIVELEDTPYEQLQKDQDGNDRKVVIFPLKLLPEMSEKIVNMTDIDYYSAIIDGSKIAKLIVDNNLDGKGLTPPDDAETNNKRYHSIIIPVINEYKGKYRQLTPNKLLAKILTDYAEKKGLLDIFDCKGFHFVGHKINPYTWAVLTKKDATIKNLKFSFYPQLYITITQNEIRFGFSYGDQVKDSDRFVEKIRSDSNLTNKIIQITRSNPDIKFYQNTVGTKQFTSENMIFPIDYSTIQKNWNRSSVLVSVYPISDLPQDIDAKIETVFNSLLELFLETSQNGNNMTVVSKPDPIPNKIQSKKQVILYGPPGTGKTYGSVIRAHEIIYGYYDPTITFNLLQEKLKRQKSSDIDYSQLSWLDAIILAFKEIGKPKVKVEDIKNSEIILQISQYKKSQTISNTIWYILQRESKLDSATVNLKNKSGREFFDKDIESNWYLTDKGLEYQQGLVTDLTSSPETSSSQFNFITFHQSFAYEDFIEGIRPKVDESEEGTIYYQIKDGIFKEICKKAALDPNNNYVLIIDEINRGNISKIFGELITLLEDNKRAGETEALIVKLPYSGEEFSVPNNVHIIGTMNSTDKSIALVDIALRRRFDFERLNVDYSVIKNQDAKKFLQELNGIICAIKNPDHEIGHYYFMRIPENDKDNGELKTVFSSRILPLLEEYFFNDWEALATILGRDSININKRRKLVWDEDSGKFETDSGDTDQIFGLSLKDDVTVFENTMKNLRIYQ